MAPGGTTLLGRLSEFAVEVAAAGPPEAVAARAAERVLDTLGVALAAVGREPVESVRRVACVPGGPDEATVLATGDRLPAPMAALVNGTMAHALDFDDTHLPSVLHPSASVVPAALAASESVGADGASLLAAVVVGEEIACRLGMAAFDPDLGNSIFFEKGLHATSICGTIASAAAAALVAGGDAGTVAHAMAIATSMGAGLLEANRTGGSVKPVHCGWAAHSGIIAARLAAAGLTGPPTALEGRFGFFTAYTDGRADERALVDGLGKRWEIDRIFTKPYPSNHFTHAGIDAALALRSGGVRVEDIVAIELGAPAPVLRTIAEPREEKIRPRTGHHAKFSGPFTVATALLGGGGLGVASDDFTDASVRDPERLRLAEMVECIADDEAERGYPYQLPAVLRVTLRDGSVREHRVRHTRGGPERPLSPPELAAKFRLNAAPVVGEEAAGELIRIVRDLGRLGSLGPLVRAAVKDPTSAAHE